MPATQYQSNRTQRAYIGLQPSQALTTIAPGSALQQILHQSISMTAGNPVERQPFKTGTSSALAGIRGRQDGSWSLTAPIIPSGTVGTVPNLDALFQSMFGQTSTAAVYTFRTARIPISLFMYDESGLALPTHMYALGALPTQCKISFGGPFLMATFSGRCIGVGDSDNFASYTGFDAVLKGGASAFPTEPSSPTTVGSTLPGWGGVLSIDSNVLGECRGSLEVTFDLGYEYISDAYANPYSIAVVSGGRSVSISNLTFINSDNTALQNVKQKAFLKTPMPVRIAHGNVTGLKMQIDVKNVQFPQGAFTDNGSAVDVNFNGAVGAATSVGVEDDATLTFA